MRIKEIPGTILSNNSNANGSFYVVHAGDNNDKRVGSVELHEHDTHGLVAHWFNPVNVPSLTVDLCRRDGQQASFGRMHVWLRVLVSRV